MIQEIFPHRFNNQYLANRKIHETDFIIHFNENSLLFKTEGDAFEIPQKKDFPEISDITEYTFLFSLDDIPYFLIWHELKADKPGFVLKEISFFRKTRQKEIAWISLVAFHLRNWYAENQFCGKCGTRTQQKPDERALICPACHTIVFPKISPAIIVAVICDDKILLARGINFPVKWYSLLAGYADIGETLEEAVIREVKEEVGLDVKNIRYYKSQPWPLSGSMMIGFIAEADETQPLSLDETEIAEAAWFSRGELPNYPPKLSIAGEMIEKFERKEL